MNKIEQVLIRYDANGKGRYIAIVRADGTTRQYAYEGRRGANVINLTSDPSRWFSEWLADGRDALRKAPSFEAVHGRKPVAGVDYDLEKGLCRDEYEYLTGRGRYGATR